MASFTFRGDPRDGDDRDGTHMRGHGPDEIVMFGLTFPKGEPVEVKDAHAIKKLKGHSHFQDADADWPREAAQPEPTAKPKRRPAKPKTTTADLLVDDDDDD